jgi:hypothetical protein
MPNLRKWNTKRERRPERASTPKSSSSRDSREKWKLRGSFIWRKRGKRSNTSSRCLKRIKKIYKSRKSIRKKKGRRMFVHRKLTQGCSTYKKKIVSMRYRKERKEPKTS